MSGDPKETQQVDEFARCVQIADAAVEKKARIPRFKECKF
jgi:hypothetical protein